MFGKYPAPQQSTYYNQYGNDNDEDEYDDMDEEGTIPLEEDIDSNYDPSEEEIIEYAEYLGMDSRVDREFFYIAREGLKAPLPKPWRAMRNSKGEIFYVNQITNEMTFVHPCDEFYKNEFLKAKTKNSQKKQQQNNMQSRNQQETFGKNSFNVPPQKLNPPTQLGALKPKGILSSSNNNSLLLSKNNLQSSVLNNNNSLLASGSKNNSIQLQNFGSNNKQMPQKNESVMKNDSINQSNFQNNDSIMLSKSIYAQGQYSSNIQNHQTSNEVFIFDEQSGNGMTSNNKINKGNSFQKNETSFQSFEENQYDQNNYMRSSMNQSRVEGLAGESNNNLNENKQRAPMYTEQSDAMNDDQIEEELHFFENYLKKQYQNQIEEYEKQLKSKKDEYEQKKDTDQIKQKNKREEFQEEKSKKQSEVQKKLSQIKEKVRKEKYNELILEMEKQIKQIKQQHEENVESTNKRAKEDYQYELDQYQEDKQNQYQYKIEEQKKQKKKREELIIANKDKIELSKKRLNQKFQELEVELQYQQLKKLEEADADIQLEYQQIQQNYIKELEEEENRIYKLINRDEKDVQKEIFQKKIQLKDLYQRKYDVKKTEEMNKISDKLRKFQQEQQILLEEKIKREEQDFIDGLIKQKLKEPQKLFQKQLDDLTQSHEIKLQDIKHNYESKIKNYEVLGLKRINDLRTELEKENQKLLNQSFNSNYNSNIDIQQQKVLDELHQSVNLKKQDLKLVKQQQKYIQNEMSKQLMIQDLLQSENRVDFLKQLSDKKSEQIDSYGKMISYTAQKGLINSQNLFNSNSQYKQSSNKKYDLPLQINNLQMNMNMSKNQEGGLNQVSTKHQQNHHNYNNMYITSDQDQQEPISTYLHQNLQQLAHQKNQERIEHNHAQQNQFNQDQNNPPHSNRVIFPDDDSDDDFHDSFTQEQQRQKYIGDSENIRNQINKAPHDREENLENDNEEFYQNNMPLQRQDLSYRRSSNGQSHNQQIMIHNQLSLAEETQGEDEENEQQQFQDDQQQQNAEDPLIQFLDEEWQQIDQLKEELRFDKIIIKKSYEFLQYEKNKMKQQVQLIESNSHQTQESQNKIKVMKNKLQQLTDAFNQDVQITRQNQKFLQNREEALFQIEDLLESGNFTQEELSQKIDHYQKSVVQYVYPKLNKQIRENQQIADHSKGNMSIEELLQRTFDLSQNYGDFTTNFQLSNYQTQYKQQLDKQLQLYQLEKQFIQEDNNINLNSRKHSKYQNFLYTDAEQLDQIFEEHTNWLKNMKQQLNNDLYTNRYSQDSTKRKQFNFSYDNLKQKMLAANLLTKRIGNMTVLNL
ncbi:WW domain protein (macronuclear) [Tetrahymena thermophila SB210]|uniref:WW domain protein n=1 Tax=Tetrahymena thermophila (strain SB210) TaxID=312017 RepID=Q234Z2_TETTS|nr:WW domain protein [Tetrahymena thermophila SB210]EAR91861.2 WW domain protein [Tetrahymena thermophila SB210]|eukprot:XP_001012106.2 WW domain protein [Tetrahymena thermophila SB210]